MSPLISFGGELLGGDAEDGATDPLAFLPCQIDAVFPRLGQVFVQFDLDLGERAACALEFSYLAKQRDVVRAVEGSACRRLLGFRQKSFPYVEVDGASGEARLALKSRYGQSLSYARSLLTNVDSVPRLTY